MTLEPVAADAVAALARRAASAPWFAAVGEALTDGERSDAARYLGALGFAAMAIDGVADWLLAKALADAPDWDPAWWDAEERLRVGLLDAAAARHGRAPLLEALSRATQGASDRAHGEAALATTRAGIADPALARAAAGAATQACYLAALATAAALGADHPFHAKFRLFEGGRWPLGIVAGRFRLF
jgi:hypothetical protein